MLAMILGRKSSSPDRKSRPPQEPPRDLAKEEIDEALKKMHKAVDKPLDTLSQKIRVALADCEELTSKRRPT